MTFAKFVIIIKRGNKMIHAQEVTLNGVIKHNYGLLSSYLLFVIITLGVEKFRENAAKLFF